MTKHFVLDTRLERDSVWLADWSLCQVRLHKDSNYPWYILVPQRNDIVEIIDLTVLEQQQLWQESALLSTWLREVFKPAKLNVAALGNIVSQLHVHHIVRYTDDSAWPEPIWGKVPAKPYPDAALDNLAHRFRQAFPITA